MKHAGLAKVELLNRYTEPEGGALADFTVYSNLPVTLFDDDLTDGEPETCALHEVVELDEAFEDAVLCLLGDSGARVFTIDVKIGVG